MIACHGAPAPHFAEFAKELSHAGYRVEILATGPALDKLRAFGAIEFNIDDPDARRQVAERVADSLGCASVVIVDVGHVLMADVLEAIEREAPSIKRLAYYENPEPFVPGGYSQTAEKVMAFAEKVLFANANLANEPLYSSPDSPISLPLEKRVALGYYPIDSAGLLKNARDSRKEAARAKFFEIQGIQEKGQKILVYLGGNNTTYFEKAFPAFLDLLNKSRPDPSQYLVVMQHHPGDKKREIDSELSGGYPLIVSTVCSDETLLIADAVLYYQTSLGPLIALAGIPVIQVGHDTYPDILVRGQIAMSATTPEAFLEALRRETPPETAQLLDSLGFYCDWLSNLKNCL